MWQPWRCVLLLLISVAICAPVDEGPVDAPAELTPDQFSAMSGVYFLKFYSPYCGTCKAMAPRWQAAYQKVGGESFTAFKWGNVDCVEHGDFCKSEEIQGWPTLRIYKDGKKAYQYSKPFPSEDDLAEFATNFKVRGEEAFGSELEAKVPEPQATQESETVEATATAPVSNDRPGLASKPKAKELTAANFGPGREAGRWFVLFTGVDCEECEPLLSHWNGQGDASSPLSWGTVDCVREAVLCDVEGVVAAPTLRIYQDGSKVYTYEGTHDPGALDEFAARAAVVESLESFKLDDPDAPPHESFRGSNALYPPDSTVPKPNFGDGTSKPELSDVVQHALDTLGKAIDEDPGAVVFGSPQEGAGSLSEAMPNAPPPAFLQEGTKATMSGDEVRELDPTEYERLVKSGDEPWLLKFYSPRCPHCQQMAPAYAKTAPLLKGRINVGAVNCELHLSLCQAEGVTYFPYLKVVYGSMSTEPYDGKRTTEALVEYATTLALVQVPEIDSQADLVKEVSANLARNETTFIYLYDDTVTDEDWKSISIVGARIAPWGGKIYRSNSSELRGAAEKTSVGPAFLHVDISGSPGEEETYWYPYQWSNIPKLMRDIEMVSKWAYRTKWTVLQHLDPIRQGEFSPFFAVMITNNTIDPSNQLPFHDFKALSLEMRQYYNERQSDAVSGVRIDRLKKYDEMLARNDFRKARHLMQEVIDLPLYQDIAFAHISEQEWMNDYAKYFAPAAYKAGAIVFIDFRQNEYADELAHLSINADRRMLLDLVTLFDNRRDYSYRIIRKFTKSLHGIPSHPPRPMILYSREGGKVATGNGTSWFFLFKVISSLVVLYLAIVKILLPKISPSVNSLPGTESNSSKHE